jgi:hypothetical protein
MYEQRHSNGVITVKIGTGLHWAGGCAFYEQSSECK